jgi:hypothetical protein
VKKQRRSPLQHQLQTSTMKPPLIRINSDRSQFVMKQLDRNYNYNEFCSLISVNVDPNERNVFVKAGSIKMYGLHTLDVILLDKVSVLTPWH